MYAVQVKADQSNTWSSNGRIFETVEEARVHAVDLFMRWTAVRTWRVVEVVSGDVKATMEGGL